MGAIRCKNLKTERSGTKTWLGGCAHDAKVATPLFHLSESATLALTISFYKKKSIVIFIFQFFFKFICFPIVWQKDGKDLEEAAETAVVVAAAARLVNNWRWILEEGQRLGHAAGTGASASPRTLAHCHSVLRPAPQGRRLAHVQRQGRHRRAPRSTALRPHHHPT